MELRRQKTAGRIRLIRTAILCSILLTPFFVSHHVEAATVVDGLTITTDTAWTKANSPYLLAHNGVVVEVGATLTLEPGVIIKSDNSDEVMVVRGGLKVQGNPLTK